MRLKDRSTPFHLTDDKIYLASDPHSVLGLQVAARVTETPTRHHTLRLEAP